MSYVKQKRESTCCFAGHRPGGFPWGEDETAAACRDFKMRLEKAIIAAQWDGYRHFICGMAMGLDIYAGEAVAALREKDPFVTLEAAVPCPEQTNGWPAHWIARYTRLLEQCDQVTVVEPHYSKACMLSRNRYMVDNSARLIAALREGSRRSGTLYTVNYAKKQGIETVMLPLLRP
ncbi:MAG: DUF1273 domain-containing protein [Oscillospiraceae bacterium]|nr:DUF1273 domain-containing protein [Oscillospiraceae bacterium]